MFRRRLRHALSTVHHDAGRIHHDDALREILVALYPGGEPDRAWSEFVGPYLCEQRAGLLNVWREHREDTSFTLLDRPEALLVLERAERDRERLRRTWPGPPSVLVRVSDVWGVPL